jgi:sigma-B regulation protein RsbU (phosphoserine phosphatase)
MAQLTEDRLALLYRISQTFNSSLDLDEVLNHVMDEVIAATRAERGFIMLRDADGALTFPVARGIEQRTLDEPAFQVSRSIVERVAREGQPLLTSDAQADQWLKGRVSVMSLGLRAILCVPLQLKGQRIGVVYVDNRLQAGIFSQADLDLLTAIAASAAIAIENARLYQVAVEKGRIERELQLAREVQASLLPRETPHLPGWEFAAYWQPALEVAGDFYDFVTLNERQLGLIIADVSDKGMPAALLMALSRSVLRASLPGAASPAAGITHANRLVCADATNNMFVTLFYAQLDSATGGLTYVNAGHNPPWWYRAGERQFVPLKRTGMPLGVFATVEYAEQSIHLEPGDVVLLYTDGVTDALDIRDQEFGLERLKRLLDEHPSSSSAELVARLRDELHKFTGPHAPFDDITVVVLKRQLM